MFTEGLDESAIKWIKQGSNVEKPELRTPLTEKYDNTHPIPRSPLGYGSSSSHVLPPLKFHSGLLGPHNSVAYSSEDNYADDDDDEDEDYDEHDEDSESVASVPDELDRSCLEEEEWNEAIPLGSSENMPIQRENAISNQIRGNLGVRYGPKLNRGLSKEYLRIEVPDDTRRYTDSELGFEGCGQRSAAANRSSRLPEIRQSHSAYATPLGKFSDGVGVGTPSAPPLMEIRPEGRSSETGSACSETLDVRPGFDEAKEFSNIPKELAQEITGAKEEVYVDHNEQHLKFDDKESCREDNHGMAPEETEATKGSWEAKSKVDSPYYDASDQNAWQSLIAYDACIRLCLNAWARGCLEAPEFLRDECALLRSAFGLHKFLLQPHSIQSAERTRNKIKQVMPLKRQQIAGKIRLEVKKVRIITRKLKSANSLRGAMYVQVGAEYVRHVSSLVKSGINSLKLASSSLTSEEPFSCLVQLKSSLEDNQDGLNSVISLHPGTGDYHDFFSEDQGDSLLLEVFDMKKNIQGRAVIPVSSLTDNPTEKVRWWPIYHDDHECIGKVQLSISWTFTNDESTHIKNAPIVETFAYDLLLEAAMRANKFHARNLNLGGPWKWLLTEFAEYYGVSDSYTKLRYLSYVMNVATPTKNCIELVYNLLLPVFQARNDKRLTRQEKSILLNCETQVESLLADVFENYKSLDENCPTGIADMSAPILESAAPSLAPAVQVYTLLHDILAEDAKTILRNYFQTAAMKRCRKHMLETDEFLSSSSEFLMDSMTMSTAYLKMKSLCFNISNEIQADLKIHEQHILPSSIDLASITAAVYSTELCKRLRSFLSAWPPSSPQPYVNELLVSTSDFERNLESWNIRPVVGGVDSRDLYHGYIMVWVQDMQVNLLDHCKAEKVPWSGVITNYSTSPFAEEMFENLKVMLHEYEVVINRWPQYTLILENAVANVERAIIKALEKQYNDILTPLKDSVPKKLGMQVQKLARRQSTAFYTAPLQLGTFLNTLKRILDVLHCKIEDILKAWASYLPLNGGEKKSSFGEHMNGVTVLLRTKYKNYMQAIVVKLAGNMQANRSTRLQRILEETKVTDGEAEIRERMQILNTELSESISNLHEVFTSRIFVAICRGFWDKMGQIVLKFLEGRKENRVWFSGSYHALGILDDIFASQMQRLQGNALQEKDLEPPRSINEARSILCRDTTNGTESSTYLYF